MSSINYSCFSPITQPFSDRNLSANVNLIHKIAQNYRGVYTIERQILFIGANLLNVKPKFHYFPHLKFQKQN